VLATTALPLPPPLSHRATNIQREGRRNRVSCTSTIKFCYQGHTGSSYLNIMQLSAKFRRGLRPALAALLLCMGAAMVAAQPGGPRRAGGYGGAHPAMAAAQPGQGAGRGQKQEHLAQWMDRHSNLPLADQQRALANEPGFRDLPPQTQQAMQNRLTQLNNMPPDQRRRLLEHTEAMEQLTPPQRQQVRGAMQEYRALPIDRRRMVARAFRDLREMPQPQRQAILGSDRFRSQFSDQERNTLSSLLAIEPYIPVQHPNEGSPYGK
jgi:hypothetical protein